MGICLSVRFFFLKTKKWSGHVALWDAADTKGIQKQHTKVNL